MQELLLAATNEMKDVILEVQEKHQFYNYDIFHSLPLTSEKSPENASIYNDFRGANFPGVVNFDKNYGTQIGTQNNIPEPNKET
ncbi:MAG: hypothetical protein HC908_12320 [Calothrix sp. SM1_7_51]|nr:hypothetical protein [Calothrix sp. SM1_7_51]